VKPLPKLEEADRAKADAALRRGAQFLLAKAKNGLFEGRPGEPDAGLTAMAIGALECVPEPRAPELQQTIDKGLAWLASLQKPDGSIHAGQLANYTTSAAILALVRSGRADHAPLVKRAREWLIALQADEAEGFSPDHPFYGGNSYGDEQRPDLSNVQFALEALAASGLEKGDEAYKRALVFLQRCQNRSESNDVHMADTDGETIVSGDDGGAAYAPGTSKAGFVELGDGRKVARSYGSMSYALLKGYVLCGLPKDDPRMRACWEWLRKNYTLDVNPGFEHSSEPSASYQGLFYYLHTMARTLAVYGEEVVVDAQGRANPWRKQLCGRLVAMQSKIDGSWVNENASRWWEGNPVLATTYAVLALDAAMPK
jgi:squalene-hopene/tetraprenyl-beta-curcumene cyclase